MVLCGIGTLLIIYYDLQNVVINNKKKPKTFNKEKRITAQTETTRVDNWKKKL